MQKSFFAGNFFFHPHMPFIQMNKKQNSKLTKMLQYTAKVNCIICVHAYSIHTVKHVLAVTLSIKTTCLESIVLTYNFSFEKEICVVAPL